MRVEECTSACARVGVEVRETEREKEHMHEGERERECAWLLLLYVFFLLGLPYANWAHAGVLFYLKSSLQSLDLSLTFLYSIFRGFSLPCLLATAILDSFSLFYLPNKPTCLHLNLAKIHSLPTEITDLVSGVMKLRFLMCHHRKNSVRDKVLGKKWIYSERNTLHRVWAITEDECSLERWHG